MLYREYKAATHPRESWRPDASLKITSVGGTCAVDDLYPMPVIIESMSISRSAAIDILDEAQQPLGILLTCKNDEYNLPKFGAAHLAAYLLDVHPDGFNQPGKFSSDYVLIRKQRLKEYRSDFLAA